MITHGIASQAYCGVLPMAIGAVDIEIFITHIKAAVEADSSVYDHDFPMITVIHKNIEYRN